MPNARDDIAAIEHAADLLARGLNTGDISSLSDFVTDLTVILPPARRTFKGQKTIEFWRNQATTMTGYRLVSSEIDQVAEGLMRDVGTLSVRPKQREERNVFRYMMLWQKTDGEWKLLSMTWNRDAEAAGGRGKGQAASGQGEM